MTAPESQDLSAQIQGLQKLLDEANLPFAQRLAINRELGSLSKELAGGVAFKRRLEVNRRVVEIRAIINGAAAPAVAPAPAPAPAPEPTPEPGPELQGAPATGAQFGLKSSGVRTREKLNAAAREIVARVKAGGLKLAELSQDDVEVLRQYSGKGGLTDNSQSEYYTPTPVAEACWDILGANGFKNGNVLEPSTGAGVFSATKPAGVIISGAEIDETSSAVAQLLHPEDKIVNSSFERMALSVADGTFDAVNGNVPFGVRGKEGHHDPAWKHETRLERYFVRRVVDKVRPGGLICLIVPVAVIGQKDRTWAKWRAELSLHAEFLGGHKLPSKTFGKQGTDVVTDIIVLRKHSAAVAEKIANLDADTLRQAGVLFDEFIEGRYFQGEGQRFIHGTFVPGNPDDFRKEDKVIADPGLTDAALKAKLARQFDSRINYELLDAKPDVVHAYAEGDRKVINGAMMELRGGRWVPFTPDTPQEAVLDKASMGVESLAQLEALLRTSEGMLGLTAEQAYKCWKKYPHLFSGAQEQAIKFAMSQPLEKFREVAYRGSLLGALVNRFARGADATDRERVQQLLADEVERYGHPAKITGMVIDGAAAQQFGVYLGAVDSDGKATAIVTGDGEDAKGYKDGDILSIVAYLSRQSADLIEPADVAALYKGPRKIDEAADVGDVAGVAITPAGDITTTDLYCCGDVYTKVAQLQDAIAATSDERLKDHWAGLIRLMMGKVKRTDVSAVGFGLRDNWIPAKYKMEFLRLQGYDLRYVNSRAEDVDQAEAGGIWQAPITTKSEFTRQLAGYMGGLSIGHNLRDRNDSPAAERKDEYQQKVNGLEEQFKYFMRSHQDGADLAATYDMTFNRHVQQEFSTESLGLKQWAKGVKPHPYQNAGVRRLSEEGNGILGFDVGLGKSAPLDEPVLTPDGWKPMGDIKVGDKVIGRDGLPTEVLGVFPQGVKPAYRVTFNDGASTRCCDEHLWYTSTETDRARVSRYRRQGKAVPLGGSVKSLREIMGTLRRGNLKNHSIPMVEPVQNPARELPVHPYLLGALIGDGCLSSGQVTITKSDEWLHGRICSLVAATMPGAGADVVHPDDRCDFVRLSGRAMAAIEPTGMLGKRAWEKSIPDDYMHASVQQRIELLRGLMDTDGWVSKDGAIVQFTTTSQVLAGQVRQLAMSLGANAWISTKNPQYTYKGEKKAGRKAFTVGLRMPTTINPFALPRKADLWRPNTKYLPTRLIESVEYVGDVPQQCIAVANPEHLYVTRDYIVTHNTFTSLAYSSYDRQMGRSKKHCIVVPKSVLANWYNESKAAYGNHAGVLFVGFEPKRDKAGVIVQEDVLDENGKPKINKYTKETERQDVLVEDSPADVFAKMHSIPAMETGVVIMTYEKFKSIPLKPQTIEGYADKWVERSMTSAANAKKLTGGKEVKEGSYAAQQQQARLGNRFGGQAGKVKEELPYFEDMGFDRVIVDEAHSFKASFQVKEGLDKLAYLPNPVESQRAQDMAMKLSYLRERNGGKGSILLTATPVANSPIEIYNMLMHVVPPEELDKLGIFTPADFVRFFGVIESVQKLTVAGVVEARDGLKGFRNLNILRGLFNRYSNMMGAKDVDPEGNVLKLPEAQEVKSQAHMTDAQKEAYVALRKEAKDAGDPRKVAAKQARPMFAVLRDMDRVTTDMDLFNQTMTFVFKTEDEAKLKALIADMPESITVEVIDPDTEEKAKLQIARVDTFRTTEAGITYVAPEGYEYNVVSRLQKFKIGYVTHPTTPKYAELIKNMKAELAGSGKQLVFTEEKSQHGKLERLLIQALPEADEKIGIINADTASGEKLQQIVDAYTRGDFKIIICNKKAEVGVNLQQGTTAVHHMTLPWTPASIQQRNGRAVRQGNKVGAVRIYYYQAVDSFDEYRLDLLSKKANWINALLDKNNTEDEHDNEDASGDIDAAALLADNREQFLAEMAAAKAKRDAEARERRESQAKVQLMQLQAAQGFLRTFEARKASAQAEADEDLAKARAALQKALDLPDDDPEKTKKVQHREANVRWHEGKAAKVAATMDQKRADAEARMRQMSGTLKAVADRGELPFARELVDNPSGALMSFTQIMGYKGGIYEVAGKTSGRDVFMVTGVQPEQRTVDVEFISHGYRYPDRSDGNYDFDKLLGRDGREIHMSPDEVQLTRLLSKPVKYAKIGAMLSREKFDAVRERIKIEGGHLTRKDGVLSDGWGSSLTPDAVYPSLTDEATRKELARQYGLSIGGGSERPTVGSSSFRDVMPAFFGDQWTAAIGEYLNLGKRDDCATQMLAIIGAKYPPVFATVEAARAAMSELASLASWNKAQSGLYQAMASWVAERGYVNTQDCLNWGTSAAQNKRAELMETIRQMEAREREEARAAAEAAKAAANEAAASDPRFKRLLPDQAQRFAALGIEARYNNGDQVGASYAAPFSMLMMRDTRGYSGKLRAVKDMMKPRFGARWCGAKSVPAGSEWADNWGVPASTNVDALLAFLEE